MNPYLILGPLGVILVGIFSIGIWRLKRHVGIRYSVFGGLVWLAAIAPKFVMDYTVTPTLSMWATDTYGFVGTLVIFGLYIGLTTGAFECGFTFLAFSKSKLKGMSLDEATAFGIGFGAFEAILIGFPSLFQIAAFILDPSLLDLLPPAQREIVEASLGLPTWVVPASPMERVFTLFVHLFTALLVFISVTQSKPSFFLGAFFYKSLLDALVPYIQTIINMEMPVTIYVGEIWVIAMGTIALAGTYWTRKAMHEYQQQTPPLNEH